MIKCEMCGDLVHETVHGVCRTCVSDDIRDDNPLASELCECVTNQCDVH